ncbi:hypothetical protein ABZ722_30560 [Streptomyces longwoodensis]|uniref:hypothetical protein n=1 Tax=Streptomyces longwoodensis TaxID=68231 RepID=UPI0033D7CE5D
MDTTISETLRRLDAQIQERDLDRSTVLNAQELANRTSLPLATVRALLRGRSVQEEPFNERVLARIKTFVTYHKAATGKTEAQLITEVMKALPASRPWARSLVRGEKVPNSEMLHGLATYFELPGSETYFTCNADEALNRELQRILLRYEAPQQDPIQALLDKYGVKAADMRAHGNVSKEQLAALLEGVVKSVIPPKGGKG